MLAQCGGKAARHPTNQCAASKPYAKKIETEIHLLRMLSNSPLQVNVEFLRISERPSKHTPIEHMDNFYKEFKEIKHKKYDGMIITGAPLGQIPFHQVTYWKEMTEILDWTLSNVTSVMFLCWAVQAAMFHLYNVDKILLPKKLVGYIRTVCATIFRQSREALTKSLTHPIQDMRKCQVIRSVRLRNLI